MTQRFRAPPDDARRRRGQAYVALAAVTWSTAGALQRELQVDLATQVAGRALLAMIALLAYVAWSERGRVLDAFRTMGTAGLGFALCLAVASSSFIAALNHTTVANVLFLRRQRPSSPPSWPGCFWAGHVP